MEYGLQARFENYQQAALLIALMKRMGVDRLEITRQELLELGSHVLERADTVDGGIVIRMKPRQK